MAVYAEGIMLRNGVAILTIVKDCESYDRFPLQVWSENASGEAYCIYEVVLPRKHATPMYIACHRNPNWDKNDPVRFFVVANGERSSDTNRIITERTKTYLRVQ